MLALRQALDTNGFERTRIVAPDGSKGGTAAEYYAACKTNPALAAATHAVGFHYPDSAPGVGLHGSLPLWASEDDSTVSPPAPDSAMPAPHPRELPGGGCLVRTLNENFVRGNITATIVWNLIMARYPLMRWDYTGLLAATDPFGALSKTAT